MTQHTVPRETRLLDFLFEALAPRSRTAVRKLLAEGRICVNGQPETAFDIPLRPGDRITVGKAPARPAAPLRRMRLVYEDPWLAVIDKEAGLPTVTTGREGEDTAFSLLTAHYSHTGTRPGKDRPDQPVFIVHRLDRETSGLLVFARDARTRERLQQDWNGRILERKYTAWAEGHFEQPEGRIESWLTEHPKSLKVRSCPYDNGGRHAVTCYRVLAEHGKYTCVELSLETGRKNQIRVHLASIGHPVAGDRKYGAAAGPFGRLALHATVLAFVHPVTGRTLRFESRAPFRLPDRNAGPGTAG